jgi:hypothetical protein
VLASLLSRGVNASISVDIALTTSSSAICRPALVVLLENYIPADGTNGC